MPLERRLGADAPPFRAGEESFVESLLEAWKACGWPALHNSRLLPRGRALGALGLLDLGDLDALPPEDVLVVLGCRELPLFHLSRLPQSLVGRCIELANGTPSLGHGLLALSLLEYRSGRDPKRRAACAALEKHLSDLHPTNLWLRLRRHHEALVRMDEPLAADELLLLGEILEGARVEALAPTVFETVLEVMQRVRSPVAAQLAYVAAIYALPSDILLPLLSRLLMMSPANPEHRQAAKLVARLASICGGSPYLVLRFAAVQVWAVAATLDPGRYGTRAAEAREGRQQLERLRLFADRRTSVLFRWPIGRLHQEVAQQMLVDEADWLDHLARRMEG
jgi:hypothetical protein